MDNVLAGASTQGLAEVAQGLSERYRAGHGRGPRTYLPSQSDVEAYAASRLPATFAAVHAVLDEVARLRPGWVPRTMLDVGAGPGTAGWTASAQWPDMHRLELVERNERMIALGRQLARQASARAMREAVWRHEDCQRDCEGGRYDLVLASYLLGEVPQEEIPGLVSRLWAWSAEVLVLIEPGTPRGFALIRGSRERLIAEGALILAPCPHSRRCPMPAGDWCHFAQRVARSRLHRTAKRADLGYEDEKYAYVAVSRSPGVPVAGRVIRHPQFRPGHVRLEVCTGEGIQQRVVSRKQGREYRWARDCEWGSTVAGHLPCPTV